MELKLRLSKEDQEAFAEAILNPPAPSPALVAAFRRRAEILNKVANGAEDVQAGRVTPHDVAMEKISASLNDAESRTVVKTDEDFDNLCRDASVDPSALDGDDTDDLLNEYMNDPSPIMNLSDPKSAAEFRAALSESQRERNEQARLLGMSAENEPRLMAKLNTYRRALEKIASCEPRYPGDVVSIARLALGADGTDAQ